MGITEGLSPRAAYVFAAPLGDRRRSRIANRDRLPETFLIKHPARLFTPGP